MTGEKRWTLEVLFETHADLKTFAGYYAESAVELTLNRVHSITKSADDRYELTSTQRETLVTAEQRGYYGEPRAVTMEELAGELDVSLPAVSGRLRRGTSQLIRNTLL
ncbi:helix-turn-helix domain-containing protein [Natrinema caseinilyticum]|uniref:helix-turn-helix domain-containing protein n=1 Tax=Natrinema caseinilyticum TaxID=2961570 RepID=UPI0020C3570A|nr:helix-turn-helix domain-containing protein [Natrinema caseinilyticum]